MDQRLYPLSREVFDEHILPLIEGSYIWKGWPPLISHYQVFCAILYVLRTGIPSICASSAGASAGFGGAS